MKSFSFYEQTGILIPGALFLFGLLSLFPSAQSVLILGGVTVGDLGLFVLVAYGLGHAVAAVGNIGEQLFWWALGGMPSSWILGPKASQVLAEQQQVALRNQMSLHFGYEVPALASIHRAQWLPMFGQVYQRAMTTGALRIEAFNGNYGLNRGLAVASALLLAIVIVVRPYPGYFLISALGALVVVFTYRMHRFGVHFAREVFCAYLNQK